MNAPTHPPVAGPPVNGSTATDPIEGTRLP